MYDNKFSSINFLPHVQQFFRKFSYSKTIRLKSAVIPTYSVFKLR